MGVKKSIQRLLSLPTEMRIEEIHAIFSHFRFTLTAVRGSHFQFKNEYQVKITIPVHNGKVKKIYLKIIKRHIMALLKNNP
jgi:predicted RNA binding protein YcfA (HicA-like mRNA interferase family)